MTINICRTCDKKSREEGALSFRIEAKGHECLLPSQALAGKKKALKKSGNWNEQACENWTREYLAEIKANPKARNCLNSILKTYKTNTVNPEMVIVVSENEKWSWSIRRVISGLLMGAGVPQADIMTDLALTTESVETMTGIYKTYRSIA